MSKSFLLLVCLILACSLSAKAQATDSKTRPLTNIKSPKEPIRTATKVVPAPAEPNAEAKRFFEEGLKQTEAGQLLEATQSLQQAVKLNSEYADAYAALGRAYFKMRQWQNAIDNLHRASELNTRQRQAQETRQQQLALERPETATASESTKPSELQVKRPQTTSTNSAPGASPNQQTAQALATKPKSNSATIETKQAVANTATNSPSPGPSLKPEPSPQVATVVTRPTETTASTTVPQTPQKVDPPATANTLADKKLAQPGPTAAPPTVGAGNDLANKQEVAGSRVAMGMTPTSQPLVTNSVTPTPAKSPIGDNSLTKIYRVGPNDILDIRVNDSQSPKSTLFTVTPSGLLEHPLLVEPLVVSGLTAEEISARIEDDLKKRALIEHPKVMVGVRDYASHTVIVSGLVKESGNKFLMREAIPLYVVVADAQPLPEAARVTIVRNEASEIYEIDLAQAADMNLLVRPGDVVTFQPGVSQFVYLGGEVKTPGEKTYRRGLTLTQAILAAGGATAKAKVAQIGRDDGRGFLVETTFQLQDVRSGKTADPILKPGDRILISLK